MTIEEARAREEKIRKAVKDRNWQVMRTFPDWDISWAVKLDSAYMKAGVYDRWPMREYRVAAKASGAVEVFDEDLAICVRTYAPGHWLGISVQAFINEVWETVRPGSPLD
jgi:hypothetical protein